MEVGAMPSIGAAPERTLISSPGQPQGGFADLLQQAVEHVNQAKLNADRAARDVALGEAESIHSTMIAMEKADLSMRLLTQVRNKVVEAYQDVMRMQI